MTTVKESLFEKLSLSFGPHCLLSRQMQMRSPLTGSVAAISLNPQNAPDVAAQYIMRAVHSFLSK
jgi:hypothetical protein